MAGPGAGGRTRRGRGLALVAVGAVVACGGEGGDGTRRGETAAHGRDARTVPVTRMEDPKAAWNEPRRLKLVREVRGRAGLAGPSEGGEAGLTAAEIRDLAPASGGRILVLDGDRSRITVLDADGRVLRRVGRPGQGPGELRSPGRVEAGRGGGIVVLERRPPTVHRWDSTGSLLGRRRLRAPGGSELGGELAEWGPRLPAGRTVRLVSLDPADPSGGRSAVYVADSAGRTGPAVLSWSREGTRSGLPEVFGARRSWSASAGREGRGRLLVARGDRYEIRRYDLSGRLRAVVRRDVRRIPVSAGLRERALGRFAEEARRGGAPPGMAKRLRDRLPVADRLPAIGEIWPSSTDGRTWVGIPGKGEPGGPPSVVRAYDVFGAGLRYLGRVPAPPGFRLHRVRGDTLYGTWLDELGLPGVRVYRLLPSGEA